MIRRIISIDSEKCNGCGGLETAAKKALQDSGKSIPLEVVTLSINGEILI